MAIHVVDDLHSWEPAVIDPQKEIEGALWVVALLRLSVNRGAPRDL